MQQFTWQAKWIWRRQRDPAPYNQYVVFRKNFRAPEAQSAVFRIVADSWYRLEINGEWVNDGPARSWPNHTRFDVIDVRTYLRKGENEIRILARYFGCGTFHQRPQRAGLLAQLDLLSVGGRRTRVATDRSWRASDARGYLRNTAKMTIQQEPLEVFDARQSASRFTPAAELCEAEDGPWKNLRPRETALLTREPSPFLSFRSAARLADPGAQQYRASSRRLLHPGVIEANNATSSACGMATVVHVTRTMSLVVKSSKLDLRIDGRKPVNGRFRLGPGRHLLLAFTLDVFGHWNDLWIRLPDPLPGARLVNPLQPGHDNPWCFLSIPEFITKGSDIPHHAHHDRVSGLDNIVKGWRTFVRRAHAGVNGLTSFRAMLGKHAACLPADALLEFDREWRFQERAPRRSAPAAVEAPEALLFDTPESTVVSPRGGDDVELCYDFGGQRCGYWAFDLTAEAGVELDVHAVEYINARGDIQHLGEYRNSLHYVTKSGRNRFTSVKRRSGRYVFITLRNLRAPVAIRHFHVIESTYPVCPVEPFQCSDPTWDRIWDISLRTLKLCMEDTFTDCPLYEQTLWVGDARNEALYAYPVLNATDIGRNCIRLAAESLELYPVVGCQVPSSWDVLLPAWSFLWGISVWDYYWYTGDAAFVKRTWPAVMKNLRGAEDHLDEHGLFSGPYWNMFDWSPIDDQHLTVLHNSMLLVGAIDAAEKCAGILKRKQDTAWLASFRKRLTRSINRQWDAKRGAYPDSIHHDGTISTSVSQHTSFLAVLYDIVRTRDRAGAVRNMIEPPEDMVRVGSPFAIQYLFEALEKTGREDAIIDAIRANYVPMLEAGATTVWEVFPGSRDAPGGWPTRSHCHAWSASPLYFLPRIILGIRPLAPGGTAFEISPRPRGLQYARGAVQTPRGKVWVHWRIEGKTMHLSIKAPKGVRISVKRNPALKGLKVVTWRGPQSARP